MLKSPEIQDYWCSEVNDLDSWEPEDPQYVDLWFSVAIGIKGNDAADDFQVHLVSESQLRHTYNKNYLLVIPYYENWSDVMNRLSECIEDCKDINWSGMSAQLEKLYLWEYHDYKG